MSKPDLYVNARNGGRADKKSLDRALEVFIAGGRWAGTPVEKAHVMNYCLEKGWSFEYYGGVVIRGRA